MQSKRLAILVLLAVSICAARVPGQVDVSTATLKGTVSDTSGAVISGAIITVTSVDKGIVRNTKCGSDGTYSVRLLQPGAYDVQVEAVGVEKVVVKEIGRASCRERG